MAILKVLEYPAAILREHMPTLETVDPETKAQIKDMMETMYAAHGGGLAANQVGIRKRLFIMDGSKEQNQPKCFINPVIVEKEGEIFEEEGCLSFPGISARVKRFRKIKVHALDENGQPFEVEYEDDYCCRCVQHELDHLNGVVFLDYLSPLKRQMLEKKMAKYERSRF